MSFLAPFFLLLGAAAAVPLLIHILRRRIGTRVEFPAARYLARAEQEHSRSLRLRNLLLMLLRVAILLLVALAAARPVTRWVGAGHGPTALAIVLDNSLSTAAVIGGRPVFADLKSAARDVLAQAAVGDRLWLVTADGRVRGGTAATLREELARVEPLAGAGDLPQALAHAAGAVRSAGLDARQIALLTDGQRTTWDHGVALGDVQVLLWIPPGTPPANHAVTAAEAWPERWTPGGAVTARLMSRDSTPYRITLGGRSLARGTAAPGEEIVVHASPPERGWTAGTVEVEPDELPGDDVRHFAVWIGAAPGVVVSPAAGPFVSSAVDVLRSTGRIAQGNDVAIVAADELTRLPALIVAPADPVRLGAANRALERAGVPWRFGQQRRGDATVVMTPTGDATAPVAIPSPSAGGASPDISVSLRYALDAESGVTADTLARVGREPWIVAGPRYVIVASPLTPDATSLPVRAAFVPLLSQILTERLAGEPGEVVAASAGARIARPGWAEALESANGARVSLADSIDVPGVPGTYFFERGGHRVGALVVNPSPRESMLDRLDARDLAKRLSAQRVLTAENRTRFVASSFRAVSRRAIGVPLLVAALVLLLLEGVTLRARQRASA